MPFKTIIYFWIYIYFALLVIVLPSFLYIFFPHFQDIKKYNSYKERRLKRKFISTENIYIWLKPFHPITLDPSSLSHYTNFLSFPKGLFPTIGNFLFLFLFFPVIPKTWNRVQHIHTCIWVWPLRRFKLTTAESTVVCIYLYKLRGEKESERINCKHREETFWVYIYTFSDKKGRKKKNTFTLTSRTE